MVLAKRLNYNEGGNTEVLRTPEEVESSCKKKINPQELENWKYRLDDLFEDGPLVKTLKRASWRLRLGTLCDELRRMM